LHGFFAIAETQAKKNAAEEWISFQRPNC
jgi:hypothetical protein